MSSTNKKSNTLRKCCGVFSLLVAVVICIFIAMGAIAKKQTLDNSISCPYETASEYEYNTCLDREAILDSSYVLFQQVFITILLVTLPAYIILGLLALGKQSL